MKLSVLEPPLKANSDLQSIVLGLLCRSDSDLGLSVRRTHSDLKIAVLGPLWKANSDSKITVLGPLCKVKLQVMDSKLGLFGLESHGDLKICVLEHACMASGVMKAVLCLLGLVPICCNG